MDRETVCQNPKLISRCFLEIEEEGGDHHQHGSAEGDFRTGGPNCRSKNWKRNATIAMISVQLEQRRPHHHVRPIPS